MSTTRATRLASVGLLGASVLLAASPAFAAQGHVGLGTADSFAVLAGSGITNTGPTTITGDVGTPGTPSTSPPLANTGAPIAALTRTGLLLLAFGTVALMAGRQARMAQRYNTRHGGRRS